MPIGVLGFILQCSSVGRAAPEVRVGGSSPPIASFFPIARFSATSLRGVPHAEKSTVWKMEQWRLSFILWSDANNGMVFHNLGNTTKDEWIKYNVN